MDEFVNRLRSTAYSEVLSGLAPPYEARRIELALRERLAEVHHSLMTSSGRYAILELYYLRHVAWNLKVALKAKALGKSYEETVEFVDMKAEELVGRRDLLVKVLNARDVTEAVAALSGSEFHDDAEKALGSFQARKEVRFFDLFIDRAVLSAISKEYSKNYRAYASPKATDVAGVADMVALDIDAYNALSVLRAKLWGLPDADVRAVTVSPTQRVTAAVLARIAGAESVQEGIKLITPTYPAPQGGPGDEQAIDALDDFFLDEMSRTAEGAFVWQGLSPGTALALVKLLEFEVGNLSAIAIGIQAGMDPLSVAAKLRL